jgi:hypothetical protein
MRLITAWVAWALQRCMNRRGVDVLLTVHVVMPISTTRSLFGYWIVLPQREGGQVTRHGVGAASSRWQRPYDLPILA